MRPIYLEDLPSMFSKGCQAPGCDCGEKASTELILNQSCHPTRGVRAVINAGSNLLRIECNICDKLVCEIAIGSKDDVVTVAT